MSIGSEEFWNEIVKYMKDTEMSKGVKYMFYIILFHIIKTKN